jgi:hypothetical protein
MNVKRGALHETVLPITGEVSLRSNDRGSSACCGPSRRIKESSAIASINVDQTLMAMLLPSTLVGPKIEGIRLKQIQE